jgi:hypothetical protein
MILGKAGALLGASLLCWVVCAQAEDLQEGLWSISLNATMAGGQSVGPFNRSQCVTKADTRNPEKLFADTGTDCSYGDRRYLGNRFSFTIQCGGTLPMQGSGSVEFSSSHFEGEVLLNANIPGAGQIETRSQVSGTRVGDCKG